MDLPTQKALDLLHRRQEERQEAGDIHESDRTYLASCRSAALEAAELYGWRKLSGRQRGRHTRFPWASRASRMGRVSTSVPTPQ